MSSTLKIIETSNSTIFFDNLTLFHQTSPLRNKHQYNHTLPPSRQSPAKASLSYYVHCKTITLFHYALKKRKNQVLADLIWTSRFTTLIVSIQLLLLSCAKIHILLNDALFA